MKTRIVIALFLWLTAGSLAAQAEPAVPNPGHMKYHAWIELKDQLGLYSPKGQIGNLTDTTLVFRPLPSTGGENLLIFYYDIESIQVRKKDGPGMGLAFGMGGGGLLGGIIAASSYESDDMINLEGFVIAGGALIGGLAGGLTGALIGAGRKTYLINGDPQAFRQFVIKFDRHR